jgi:hypothetical protein
MILSEMEIYKVMDLLNTYDVCNGKSHTCRKVWLYNLYVDQIKYLVESFLQSIGDI